MDTFTVRQGESLPIAVALRDDQGDPIMTYLGTEALVANVWPGGNLPAAFSPSVAWISGPLGMISARVTGANTLALAEGRYKGTIDVVDPVFGSLEAYVWSMDVLPAPGSAVLPPMYATFPDLLKYGKGWLRTLQDDDEDAGFSAECGRSRSWLDDLIVASYKGYLYRGIDPQGYGPPLGGSFQPNNYPSIWLRQQLAQEGGAVGLTVTDLVLEITAKQALSYICQGQLGAPAGAFDFAKLGRYYRHEAENLAKCLRAEINQDPVSGYPQFVVVLGAMDMR